MAKTISFTIQDDVKADWIITGFMQGKTWTEQIANPAFDIQLPENPITNPTLIDNPQTQIQFLKAWIIEKIKIEAVVGHTAIRNVIEANEAFNNVQID